MIERRTVQGNDAVRAAVTQALEAITYADLHHVEAEARFDIYVNGQVWCTNTDAETAQALVEAYDGRVVAQPSANGRQRVPRKSGTGRGTRVE
jgi:hypothetical protein